MNGFSVSVKPTSVDELRELAVGGRLYAVIDACDAPAVPGKVTELGEERAACLYSGKSKETYWAIAPYLVKVDEELLDWIVATLWREPWGIFAAADSDLESMREHFRRFIVVRSPDGEPLYFRYYDPRVLKTFLESCTPSELEEFFGPIVVLVVAGEWKGEELSAYRRKASDDR